MAMKNVVLKTGIHTYDYLINYVIASNLLGDLWHKNIITCEDWLQFRKDHEIILRPKNNIDNDNILERCKELTNKYNFSLGYILTKLQIVLDKEINNENTTI